MKKTLTLSLLSMLLLFTIISCKKKDPSVIESLNGSWELRNLQGIQIPGIDPNYKSGNGNLFVFEGASFKRWVDTKAVDSGTFAVQKADLQINNNRANYSLMLNNKTQLYIKLSGTTLVVFDGVIAADGVEGTYTKIK